MKTDDAALELVRELLAHGDQWIRSPAVAAIIGRSVPWARRQMWAGAFGPPVSINPRDLRVYQPTVIEWAQRRRREEYNVAEVPDVLCVSQRTVWRLIKKGVLEVRRYGGDVQLTQASVLAYRDKKSPVTKTPLPLPSPDCASAAQPPR